MRWGGKVQIAAAGLFGAIVLLHCLWILTLALRVVRVLAERARSDAPGLWSGLVGAAATAQPLYTGHADSPGELAYALAYAEANPDILRITKTP